MVPVVVLTGFLGSGKTTLLNRLFRARQQGAGRCALIVNELGDVGVDADLLPPGAARQVELPGGCICCALVEDLETTIVEVLDSAPELEIILIETTGIADPLPIAWTLAGPRLGALVRLAAVVTVVDPFQHEASRRHSPSADAQVGYADILVVSKLDAVGGQVPKSLLASLRERNEVATLVAEAPERVAAALWTLLDDPVLPPAKLSGSQAPHDHERSTGAAAHGGVGAVALEVQGTFDLEELVTALEGLPPEVIRLKGIVRAVDAETGSQEPRLYAIHRVGARVSTEPYTGATTTATRVVALGQGLDVATLSDCFQESVILFTE